MLKRAVCKNCYRVVTDEVAFFYGGFKCECGNIVAYDKGNYLFELDIIVPQKVSLWERIKRVVKRK